MTYREACEFFYRYGNVGRDVSDLIANRPTKLQLEAAVRHANSPRGGRQSWDRVDEARKAIESMNPRAELFPWDQKR
jgi:hypothetical protein